MARMPTIRWNRRAFWITLAIFGAANAAHLTYFFSLPVEPIQSKHETRMGRTEPDWVVRATIGLNIPGCYIAGAILSIAGFHSQSSFVAMSEVLGTLFWASVAALVVRPVNSPTQNPDLRNESKRPTA